jgi:hypothetical protein
MDRYVRHIGEQPILSSRNVKFNFVNTGSFDTSTSGQWDYMDVQDIFGEKLLKAVKPKNEEKIQFLSIPDWLKGLRVGGWSVGDVI